MGVQGQVARGFEGVRVEFERNFAERGEIGAAVAAYWRGEKVVDLWGGRRIWDGDAPWSGYHLIDDPREKALRDAVYRAIAVLARERAPQAEPPQHDTSAATAGLPHPCRL